MQWTDSFSSMLNCLLANTEDLSLPRRSGIQTESFFSFPKCWWETFVRPWNVMMHCIFLTGWGAGHSNTLLHLGEQAERTPVNVQNLWTKREWNTLSVVSVLLHETRVGNESWSFFLVGAAHSEISWYPQTNGVLEDDTACNICEKAKQENPQNPSVSEKRKQENPSPIKMFSVNHAKVQMGLENDREKYVHGSP